MTRLQHAMAAQGQVCGAPGTQFQLKGDDIAPEGGNTATLLRLQQKCLPRPRQETS